MKPKIEVNFNEIIDDFKILLSQSDMIIDSEGNEIFIKRRLNKIFLSLIMMNKIIEMILLQVVCHRMHQSTL